MEQIAKYLPGASLVNYILRENFEDMETGVSDTTQHLKLWGHFLYAIGTSVLITICEILL